MKKNNLFNLTNLRTFKQSSFTLIEGLVILSILVILVMAALLAYRPMRAKAYELQERTIIAALQVAVNTYYAKNFVFYGDNDFGPGVHPFKLLGDSAPKYTNSFPPPGDGITWATGTVGGATVRWHLYCPHWISGTKGNWWTYVIRDPANPQIKPGTIVLNQANGH